MAAGPKAVVDACTPKEVKAAACETGNGTIAGIWAAVLLLSAGISLAKPVVAIGKAVGASPVSSLLAIMEVGAEN